MIAALPLRVRATLLGALTWLLCGCQGRPFVEVPDQDYGVSATQFADIPVPDRMKLQEHPQTSHSSEASDWRYGNFVYSGPMPLDEATNYMLQRMPLHSWKLVSDEFPSPDSRLLRFERGIYVADCRFTRESAKTRMEVHYRTERPPLDGTPRN